jgi:hypothetical protein
MSRWSAPGTNWKSIGLNASSPSEWLPDCLNRTCQQVRGEWQHSSAYVFSCHRFRLVRTAAFELPVTVGLLMVGEDGELAAEIVPLAPA